MKSTIRIEVKPKSNNITEFKIEPNRIELILFGSISCFIYFRFDLIFNTITNFKVRTNVENKEMIKNKNYETIKDAEQDKNRNTNYVYFSLFRKDKKLTFTHSIIEINLELFWMIKLY